MLSKFSVKKPFTVLVGVILVLILGFVSFTRMSEDLLPDINLPYVIVLTTYPGASPETVETVVSAPVESSMATISNIESIQSRSSENYSIVILQFTQTANMDSVSLDIREKLDQLESYWDDSVGHPIIMKLNPNMLPQMIAAVGMPNMTNAEISSFAEEKIVPAIESIEGVASVNTTGLIEESLHVVIREDKVAKINARLSELIDEKFEEAYQQIADSREELEKGAEELDKAEKEMKKGENQLNGAQRDIANGKQELNDKKAATIEELTNAKLQVTAAKADLEAAKIQIQTNMQTALGYQSGLKQINDGIAALDLAINTINNTQIGGKTAYYDYISDTLTAYQGAITAHSLGMMSDADFAMVEMGISTLKASLTGTDAAALDMGAVFDDKTRNAIKNIDFSAPSAYTDYKNLVDEYVAYLVSAKTTTLASKGTIENQLSALTGWTVVETNLPSTDPGYSTRYATLDATVDAYVKTQNGILGGILSNINALDEKIVELYKGESEALIQFANGLSQLELAEYQINTSKTQLNSGKEELEAGKDKIDDARTQLDDAVTQIDESKEDAIKAADMTGVLTVDTVSQLLTAQNFSMPAGYIDSGDDTYLVRIGDKPRTLEDLQQMPILKVPMTEDEIIYLSDVADVFETSNIDEVYTNVNGERGVILSIQKQTGYSTGDVSDRINDRFDDLREQYQDIALITLMDQGVYIDLVMNTIFENVLIGGLLAVIVLIFFLRDIRPTLVIALSIPISLIAAVVAMYFSGVTLNIISLSGLALGVGMLVDNSIVVIENIYRLRKEGMEIKEAAVEGSREVAGAIFASTLTTVSVFLPIVFTEGITRQLFVDMGLTIAYSLIASLLIALTVVPALATGLVKNVKTKNEKSTDTGFYKVYKKFLALCLKVKPLVILLVIALLGLSVWAALQRGTAYFPEMDSTQISVNVKLAEESELTNVTDATDRIIAGIMEIPDVVDVGAMASSSSMSMLGGMSTSSGNTTRTSIYVTTTEDRTMTSQEIADAIKATGADIEGIEISVETSTMDMSAMGGSGISISVKGRDLDTLYELAGQIAEAVANTEGIAEVSDISKESDIEFRITVDKDKAILKGLTVAQVFAQIYPKLQDAKVSTQLATATEDISVYVESETDAKFTLDVLKEMTITYKDADQKDQEILLSEIADFSEAYGMATINRDNQSRVVTVSASLAEGYNIGLVSAVVEDNVDKITIPKGYSVEYGGENEMINEALSQLILMVILAVAFIYLIMVAQFQSLLSPFIIMFTIPLAFTGGFAALYFTGNEISIVSMIGFVMLSGIIVNNGIVLVDYTNQLRESGMDKKTAIVEAGAIRLRPVLMTALTTILALLTMAFSKKMGADMTKPLAIVVIGGMVYGTLMTLVVVPCIYDMLVWERRKKKPRRKGHHGRRTNSEVEVTDMDESEPVDLSAYEGGAITVEEITGDSESDREPEPGKKRKRKKTIRERKPRERKLRTSSEPANPYMSGWN